MKLSKKGPRAPSRHRKWHGDLPSAFGCCTFLFLGFPTIGCTNQPLSRDFHRQNRFLALHSGASKQFECQERRRPLLLNRFPRSFYGVGDSSDRSWLGELIPWPLRWAEARITSHPLVSALPYQALSDCGLAKGLLCFTLARHFPWKLEISFARNVNGKTFLDFFGAQWSSRNHPLALKFSVAGLPLQRRLQGKRVGLLTRQVSPRPQPPTEGEPPKFSLVETWPCWEAGAFNPPTSETEEDPLHFAPSNWSEASSDPHALSTFASVFPDDSQSTGSYTLFQETDPESEPTPKLKPILDLFRSEPEDLSIYKNPLGPVSSEAPGFDWPTPLQMPRFYPVTYEASEITQEAPWQATQLPLETSYSSLESNPSISELSLSYEDPEAFRLTPEEIKELSGNYHDPLQQADAQVNPLPPPLECYNDCLLNQADLLKLLWDAGLLPGLLPVEDNQDLPLNHRGAPSSSSHPSNLLTPPDLAEANAQPESVLYSQALTGPQAPVTKAEVSFRPHSLQDTRNLLLSLAEQGRLEPSILFQPPVACNASLNRSDLYEAFFHTEPNVLDLLREVLISQYRATNPNYRKTHKGQYEQRDYDKIFLSLMDFGFKCFRREKVLRLFSKQDARFSDSLLRYMMRNQLPNLLERTLERLKKEVPTQGEIVRMFEAPRKGRRGRHPTLLAFAVNTEHGVRYKRALQAHYAIGAQANMFFMLLDFLMASPQGQGAFIELLALRNNRSCNLIQEALGTNQPIFLKGILNALKTIAQDFPLKSGSLRRIFVWHSYKRVESIFNWILFREGQRKTGRDQKGQPLKEKTHNPGDYLTAFKLIYDFLRDHLTTEDLSKLFVVHVRKLESNRRCSMTPPIFTQCEEEHLITQAERLGLEDFLDYFRQIFHHC